MSEKGQYFVVIFVEGATEVVFYQSLIEHLQTKRTSKITNYKIINAKGIGRFESKVPAKFKNEIFPKYQEFPIIVVCCYDTDVFKFKSQPPINWERVVKRLKENGAVDVKLIKATKMIEDWFLMDLEGLCSFLNIKMPKKITGSSGNEKMITLFKKSGKVYQKGTYCYKFIDNLNIELIYNCVKSELEQLDKLLFPNEKHPNESK